MQQRKRKDGDINMVRRKQAAVTGTLRRLDKIDSMLKRGKITKKQHDKRSKKVLQKVFVTFK